MNLSGSVPEPIALASEPITASGATGPCGASLEYQADYLLLLAGLAPRSDVQYGAFVESARGPDWPLIEREALRLSRRSHDIVLLACLCRTATRLRHAAGLAQALGQLSAVLQAWPLEVHPQMGADGSFDPSMRANALAALADPDGLCGDVAHLLQSLGSCGDARRAESAPALADAASHARAIVAWAAEHLGDAAPSLQPLLLLLGPSSGTGSPERHPAGGSPLQPGSVRTAMPAPQPPQAPEETPASVPHHSRTHQRQALIEVQRWFEQHEPSSPVGALLEYTVSLIGRRFGDLRQAVPPDWLQKWDAEAGRKTAVAT